MTIPLESKKTIYIKAESSFGTGQHATTKSCLKALESGQLDKLPVPKTILDLGTGTGILALAAAKLFPAAQITATDIEPAIMADATTNFQANGANITGLITDQVPSGRFDLVIANILFPVLIAQMNEITAALGEGGRLILAGFSTKEVTTIKNAASATGLKYIDQWDIRSWPALLFQKP